MAVLTQLIERDGKPYILTADSQGNPIVEPLGGYASVEDILDRFPDTVYNTNRDSHLYSFLNALCGDAGAAGIKNQSYVYRLQTEGNSVLFAVLDSLFSNTFSFPRLPAETYPWNPSTDLLTNQEWEVVEQADESYKNRAAQFMQATRLGNSPEGMALAAESATGMSCDILENYKAVYDLLSDMPLGLTFMGQTNSPFEHMLQLLPSNTDPTYQPSLTSVPSNAPPTFQGNSPYVYGDVVEPSTPNGHYYSVIIPISPGVGTSGDEPTWPTDGTTVTTGGVTFQDIGTTASFGDDAVAISTPNSSPSIDPAVLRNLLHVMDNLRPVASVMTVLTGTPHLVPITMGDFSTPVNIQVDSSSNKYAIVRYVTGKTGVNWPLVDAQTGVNDPSTGAVIASPNRTAGNFIVAGVENAQNQFALSGKDRINIYETINIVRSYTEQALDDPAYATPTFYQTTKIGAYQTQHTGPFDSTIAAVYPFLFTTPADVIYSPDKAVSAQYSPMTLERKVWG